MDEIYSRVWLERLTANKYVAYAVVATVLGSIPASSDTVESEGRQMKQCWMSYIKKVQKITLAIFSWLFLLCLALRYIFVVFSPALPEPDLLLCLALRYLSLTSSNNSDQQQQQQQVKAESSQLTLSAVYEVARPILQGCHAVQTRLVLHFSWEEY